MNKNTAKIIAKIITNEQLLEMLLNAKTSIEDWTKISSINKGMTKGVSWNILAKDFNVKENYHLITKINIIREFGDFLPKNMVIMKTSKILPKPCHAEPDFSNWKK